jgi:hypothetical protein
MRQCIIAAHRVGQGLVHNQMNRVQTTLRRVIFIFILLATALSGAAQSIFVPTTGVDISPPVIQPFSQSVDAGSSATFTAITDDDGSYVFEWQFNGQPLYYWIGSVLQLDNVQAANEGGYSAVVMRPDGTCVTNGPAYLHVNPAKPTITAAPASAHLNAGDGDFFYVQATGSEPMSYKWYREGRPVRPPSIPVTPPNWLQIFDVQSTDAGRYTIVASNAYGSATTNFTVVVRGRPPVFQQAPPPAQSVPNGSEVTLYSSAVGSEPLSFQWQFNGHNIPRATHPILTIPRATTSCAGKYTIVVRNPLGTVSASSDLKVFVPPKVVALPPNTLALTGQNVTLRSRAIAGDHPVFLQWYGDEDRLHDGPSSGVVVSADGRSLTISNITAADEGIYKIAAQHIWQLRVIIDDSTATHLIVAPFPSPVYAWGDNSAGQASPPQNLTNAIAIAAGGSHSVALRANGTVVAWGSNANGQCNVPAKLRNVVAIAAGRDHSLAQRKDGTIVAWGNNQFGQCDVPSTLPKKIIAIAAGDRHSVALAVDHTVFAWGDNSTFQCHISSVSCTRIAAGGDHSLAWNDTRRLVCSGDNFHGQFDIPSVFTETIPTQFPSPQPLAIAVGKFHCVAVGYEGFRGRTAICWGDNTFGQCTAPDDLTDVVQVGAGDAHTIALTAEGAIYCWGDNSYGQVDAPLLPSPATAIAAGANHNLALVAP